VERPESRKNPPCHHCGDDEKRAGQQLTLLSISFTVIEPRPVSPGPGFFRGTVSLQDRILQGRSSLTELLIIDAADPGTMTALVDGLGRDERPESLIT
jgi:hypothetical protein